MPAQHGAMVTFPREPANSPAYLYLMMSLVPQDSDFKLKVPPSPTFSQVQSYRDGRLSHNGHSPQGPFVSFPLCCH